MLLILFQILLFILLLLFSFILEIKLVDIVLGEEERLAEQDVVALDLDGAEPAGLQARVAGLQRSLLQGVGGLDRQVAEVHRASRGRRSR